MPSGVCLTTDRLQLRPPAETDRERFIELFTDDAFMVYAGTCDEHQAHARFDRMLADTATVAFSKRPVVERSSGLVVGYTGVAPCTFEGQQWFEYGYRLCADSRGKGYATEAGLAMIDAARDHFSGTILGMVDPTNAPSINVILKLGFEFWKQAEIDEDVTNLYLVEL